MLKSKDEFVYAKDMDRGFVLSLPNATRFRFLKMYATGDGIMRIE
ncbi:MAG: hypothetical protein M5R36_29890 [Deltaproteobacteria bacterium]|nr:hypothetical protein [Deltaproteobacteria bacterium]